MDNAMVSILPKELVLTVCVMIMIGCTDHNKETKLAKTLEEIKSDSNRFILKKTEAEYVKSHSIEYIMLHFVSIIAEKPKSPMAMYALTVAYPWYIAEFVHHDVSNRDRGIKSDYIKTLERIVDSTRGRHQLAGKLLLAQSYNCDERYTKKKADKAIRSILKMPESDDFHSLCLYLCSLGLQDDSEREGLEEKCIQANPEMKFPIAVNRLERTLYSIRDGFEHRDQVLEKIFNMALTEMDKNTKYEDNPYPTHIALKAANMGGECKCRLLKTLLEKMTPLQDPDWDGLNLRTEICTEIANSYYHQGDLEDARQYIQIGRKYGPSVHLDNLEAAIDRKRKFTFNKRSRKSVCEKPEVFNEKPLKRFP